MVLRKGREIVVEALFEEHRKSVAKSNTPIGGRVGWIQWGLLALFVDGQEEEERPRGRVTGVG
jgi:hypothetical protein